MPKTEFACGQLNMVVIAPFPCDFFSPRPVCRMARRTTHTLGNYSGAGL